MSSEWQRVLYRAEDIVRRGLRSRSAREANKRRLQRKFREALRRLRRAGLILVVLLASMVAFSLFVAPVGFLTWLVAIPTIFLAALLTLFWDGRRMAEPIDAKAAVPLDTLAARVEDGLIERCSELPGRALPAADAIIARLNELQPHLATLDANSLVAGEARRLVGQHLPVLVDTFLELPPSARTPESESSRRFAESLDTVAGELDHLLETCCRDRHSRFETQNRFIESRYSEDPRLTRR